MGTVRLSRTQVGRPQAWARDGKSDRKKGRLREESGGLCLGLAKARWGHPWASSASQRWCHCLARGCHLAHCIPELVW